MLALGGDNFSLEYGKPFLYLGWNRLVQKQGIPVVIWGGSVGPFSAAPDFEKLFVAHANRLSAILVRETKSLDYLTSIGIGKKAHLVGDPAFVMQPKAPRDGFTVPEGAIGINLSPLFAQFVTNGNQEAWEKLAVDYVRAVRKQFDRPILLIPHVNATDVIKQFDAGWKPKDDHGFMSRLMESLGSDSDGVTLVGSHYDAEELKGIISKLHCFAGARTHATIAAFSTHVPTVSLAYSVKAPGLNQDIFGTTEYCIAPEKLSVETLTASINLVNERRDDILEQYEKTIPTIKDRAMSAGAILRDSLA
jgi:polysaccharide pyruvyl transferase WcaK-like protein